jgi:hypothetical protein
MRKIIAVLLLCVFAACAATSKFAPSAEDLLAMQTKVPGITYDEAIQGYKLYVSHCGNCHRIHNPRQYTAIQWNKILPEMFEKAKITNDDQQKLIRNYLAANAK